MATSSKYVQLAPSVLMEYVYSDSSQINNPGNQYRISTANSPLWYMENENTNIPQILNADSAENPTNLNYRTSNVRNRSFAQIDSHRIALLDIDKTVVYNDYDNKLTSTVNLPIVFNSTQAPVYDTIRLHLVQGFNFQNYKGLALSVKIRKQDGKGLILSNFIYNRTDSFEIINPSPFFFGGRVYDTYVELKVLSLYSLEYEYWLGTLNGDTVVERITQGAGVARDQFIQVYFSWVADYTKVDNQTYAIIQDTIGVDLPERDQFETISAYIGNSEEGDYIEYYAKYNSNIIEQFILDLNKSGYDYMILHDITQSEYIYNSSTSSYNWIKTDEIQTSQTDNYDKANVYRPVIKNPGAIAFKLDYVVRLYNRNDNTQVWKNSSMISYDAQKYGRKLGTISLGANPVQTIIYNKNYVKEIKINKVTEPIVSNVKYIASFIDSTKISISFSTINLNANAEGPVNTISKINNPAIQNNSSTGDIFTNGLAKIYIPNSVGFLKFTIYQRDAKGTDTPLNISGIGEIILSFNSNTNEKIDILEFPSTYTSKTRGEIVYRIREEEAKNILSLSNRTFSLFLLNEKGDRTFLYSGRFFSTEEWRRLEEVDKITSLEAMINKLTKEKNTYLGTIQSQTNQINSLSGEVKNLLDQLATEATRNIAEAKTINSLQSSLSAEAARNVTEEKTINILKSSLAACQEKNTELNNQIAQLTKELSNEHARNLVEEGLISQLQKQLADQVKLNTFVPINPKRPEETVLVRPSVAFFDDAIKTNQVSIIKTPSTAMTPTNTPTLIPIVKPINISSGPIAPNTNSTVPSTTPRVTTTTQQSSSGGCMIFGTLVQLSNGSYVPIENIKVGDKLKSYRISGHDLTIEEGLLSSLILNTNNITEIEGTVSTVDIFDVDKIYKFVYERGSISSSSTHNHIVKLIDTGEVRILKTPEIAVGDELITSQGNVTIEDIQIIKGDTKVINIELDTKIYVAEGFLTHNKVTTVSVSSPVSQASTGGGGYMTSGIGITRGAINQLSFYGGQNPQNTYLNRGD